MPDIFDQINPDKKIAGDIFDQINPESSAPARMPQLSAPRGAPEMANGFSSADLAPSFAASGSGPFFAPKEQVPFGTEDRAPEWLRGLGKSVRALGPWGTAAGAGALAGAVAGEGVGAPLGALGGVAAKGIYDLGTMAGNAGVGLTNWAFGTDITPFESFDSKIDRILDRVGLPRPETDAENVVQAMTRGAVDAMAGGPALGSALANASKARSTLNSIGRTLQHAPVSQMIGGAAAGGVAESLPDSIKESDTIGGAAARTVIPMIAGIMAGTAHGVGSWGFGRTPLAPETRMALENALAARTGTDAMVQPWEIRNYVSAVEANSPVSAAVRAALKFENPADALSNRYGFQGATSAFGRVPIPEGYDSVIRNIENAQQANVNEIPGLQMATPEAAKSTGVGAFLNKGMASPQGRARQLDNLRAIARFRDEPVNPLTGEYAAEADLRAMRITDPAQRALDNAEGMVRSQEASLDSLQRLHETERAQDAQRVASARSQEYNLSAELERQQQELDALRQQYSLQGNTEAMEQSSAAARQTIDRNNAASHEDYYASRGAFDGGRGVPLGAPLNDAVASVVDKVRKTLGGKLTPEVASTLKALEEYGIAIPEEAATGRTKITKTLMPTETGAADYSGASVANFEAQTKGLKPAAGGRVRALAEGESPIETVKTPGGSKPYEVQREVVELDDLIHSMGSKNYPKDLQNLNRDSVAAANQKNVITGSFDPEQLTGRQPTGNTGAPIVGPDNVVEGGNMRTAVLGDILTKPEYAAQREAYIKRLQGMGYDVSGMRNPVEVMRRKTELTPAERLKFAEELNAKTGAERSLTETANRDAMKLDTGLMDLWEKGGIGNENNAEFIRRFAQRTMTPNEFATYFPEGKATNALGDRLDAAFLQRAYNNTKLTDTLTMSPDQRIKSIGRAMQDAAPDMARLRAKIESGEIPATHDIPTALTEAAQFIEDARARGRDPLTELRQVDAFAKPHPMRDALVEMMFNEAGRQVGGARLGEALSDMAQQAAKPADMFGDKMAPNDVLARGKGLLAKPAEGEVAASAPSAEPPSMAKVTGLEKNSLPFERYGVPSKVYRGTEAGDAVATLREHPDGELGKGYYVTQHRWLAETYGGGSKADVRDGTRVVHKYEFARPVTPEDVAYLEGGSTGEHDAVLRGGTGVEIWRGKISAKKTEQLNREAMTEAAKKAGVKVIIGNPDSVAKNQMAVLDKSLLKVSQPSDAEAQFLKLVSSGQGRSEQAGAIRKIVDVEAKDSLATPRQSPSMAKVTEGPSATAAASSEPPSPPEAGAVTLEEKPAPKQMTAEVLRNTIEKLRGEASDLSGNSAKKNTAAAAQIREVLRGLEAHLPNDPSSQKWAQHAEKFRHYAAKGLSESGPGGAREKIRARETLDQWIAKGKNGHDAQQLASILGGDADGIASVREYMVGRMASELKDRFKAGDVQKWLDSNASLLAPDDFRGIRSEIERYRDSLSAGEGQYTRLQGEIEAARQEARQATSPETAETARMVSEMRGLRNESNRSVTQARRELDAAQRQAAQLPPVRVAGRRTADIQEIVNNPELARQAADAAATPGARGDLNSILHEHFNRRYTTASEIPNTPMSNELATENLSTSLGRLVQDLRNPDFRESMRILLGDAHVRRLEMIRTAIANEQSRGGMMQGSNVGSATEPKTAASVAAEAVAQTPTGLTGRILRVAKRLAFGNDSVNTPEAHRVVVDMALNPEFTKELLKANRDVAAGKLREADIKPIARRLLRTAPKLNATSNANTRSQEDQKRSEDR